MVGHLTVSWNPEQPSIRHLHNHYVDLLLAVYLAKHTAYTENFIYSINRFDYIGYALNARSVVESASTLRYYLLEVSQMVQDTIVRQNNLYKFLLF